MYIYKDVSARTNVFSLQFPCTCICNIVYVRHKKHSYSEVPGTKEFDLSYTNLYLIRFISFAILDKMNETEFALSVNSLVISMFVIRVHVIVFYQNSLCLFSPQVLVARQHHPLSSSKFYTLFVVRAIRLGWGGRGNDQYFFPVHFCTFLDGTH